MNIPIQNIYYLLIYAWDALEDAETLELATEECRTLADLFAIMLSRGMEKIIRRGLDRGYLPHHERFRSIRGKLNLARSIHGGSLERGVAACDFDELNHDVLQNRIVASTLRRLLVRADIDKRVRTHVEVTCYRLSQVTNVQLTNRVFRGVQLHRNNAAYRLVLDVCRLIHNAGLLREDAGPMTFSRFIKGEREMRRLFERFVRNFIRHEVPWATSEPAEVRWRNVEGDPASVRHLPRMRTDTRLRTKSRRLVIETKFVPRIFQEGIGGKPTIRSPHLYQLFAYVTNLQQSSDLPVDGLLLYPVVDDRHDLQFRIAGQRYRLFTLDLNQHWQSIHDTLVSLVQDECVLRKRRHRRSKMTRITNT